VCETTCEEKTATLEQNNIHPPPKEFPSTYFLDDGGGGSADDFGMLVSCMQCEGKKPLKRAGALLMTMLPLPLSVLRREAAEGCTLPTGKKTVRYVCIP